MKPRPLLRLGLREACLLLFVALCLSAGLNAVRPDNIPWTEHWTDKKLRELGDKGVDAARAKTLWASKSALFIDARDAESFAQGHIPDAESLPYDPFDPTAEQRILGLPKDRWLVLYCSSASCPLSKQMAEALTFNGYDKVLVLAGGYDAWTKEGGPVAGSGEKGK